MSTAPASGTGTTVVGPAVGVAPADRRAPGPHEPGAFVTALATLLAPGAGQGGSSASSAAPTKPSSRPPGTATTDPADAGGVLAQPWPSALLPVGAPPAEGGATSGGGADTRGPTAGPGGTVAVVVLGAAAVAAAAATPSGSAGPPAAAVGSVVTTGVQPAAPGGAQDAGDRADATTASTPAGMPSVGQAGTSPTAAGPSSVQPAVADPARRPDSTSLEAAAPPAPPAVIPPTTPSRGLPLQPAVTGAQVDPTDRPDPGSPERSRWAPPSAPPSLQGLVGVAAPDASPSTPSPAPAGHTQPFAEQLGRPVLQLATGAPGEHVLTVRVSPEHLGPVTVQARIGSDGVHIELFSPTDAGRAAVHAALPDLRRELAGTGLGASLDLSDRGAPGQGAAAGGQAGQGGPGDGAHGRGSGPPEPHPPTVPHAPTDGAWRSTRSPHPAYAATTVLDVLA